MKKFLKVLLIIIVILLIVVLVGGLFMPKETIVEESIVINANTEVIFDYVNCLEKTAMWSPWEGIEEVNFSGPKCGVGAIQEWTDVEGRKGKQEIIESKKDEYSKTFLDFGPMGTAYAEFKLKPDEGGTKLTWTFQSDAPYPLVRWMNVIFGVKSAVSKDYKKGLAGLDSLINALPKEKDMAAYDVPTEIDLESLTLLSIRETVDMTEIGPKMGEFYGKLMVFIKMNKLNMTGYPIAIWHSFSETDNDMECGLYVNEDSEGTDLIKSSKSYAGKALVLDYFGAYDSSPDGWMKIDEFIATKGFEKNGKPWDEYITDPTIELDTAKWLTRLYQPIK